MKKKELARKITSWLTFGAFSLQSVFAFAAEILPDSNAPIEERPLVTETASGNPLVQITTPTAGGVSINRYEFFNVPERGDRKSTRLNPVTDQSRMPSSA